MSIEATLERVSAIRQALADPGALLGAGGVSAGGTEAPSASAPAAAGGESPFASALRQASAGYEGAGEGSSAASAAMLDGSGSATPDGLDRLDGLDGSASAIGAGSGSPYSLQSLDGVAGASALSPSGGPGSQIVAIAESQLGQTEQPPGSNESPAIAQYRTATAGAAPGEPWCAYFASWVARQAGEPIGEQGQGAGSVSEVWSWAQNSGRAIPNGPGVVPQPGDLIVFGDEHVGIVRDVLPNGQIQTIEGNYENKVAANVRSPTEATGYVSMG
jgi:CHAP domain